nr:unnamed protein product [Fasciola hepatica]
MLPGKATFFSWIPESLRISFLYPTLMELLPKCAKNNEYKFSELEQISAIVWISTYNDESCSRRRRRVTNGGFHSNGWPTTRSNLSMWLTLFFIVMNFSLSITDSCTKKIDGSFPINFEVNR